MNKQKWKKNKIRITAFDIEKMVIALLCVLTVFTIFLPVIQINGVFDERFRDFMRNYWQENNIGDATGLSIAVLGRELAFGIEELTLDKPILIPSEPLLAVTYFIPLLFALFVIPFGKWETNRYFYIGKNVFAGIGMILFGLINLLLIRQISVDLTSVLLEKSPELGVRFFSEVDITKYTLPSLGQMLLIMGGILYIHLATNTKRILAEKNLKTKRS